MRQYPVPALFDEKPREVGGVLTLKQTVYLGAGVAVLLLGLVSLPRWLAMVAGALALLAGGALAFGTVRGYQADKVMLLVAQYRMRPRKALWKEDLRGG